MMKKLVFVAAIALAGSMLSGCDMLKGGGGGSGGPKNSVGAVKSALGTKGVNVTGEQSLSDTLGGKQVPACSTPVERKRINIQGGYVNVANYGDTGKASACFSAWSAAAGANAADYSLRGSWILEIQSSLPADTKNKARDAFNDSID